MRGYYGHSRIGAEPSTAEIFKAIQRSLPSQGSAIIKPLAVQFNAARNATKRYAGLSGDQLNPERNPRFPRRLVIWYGRSVDPQHGITVGTPMTPRGVFETLQGDVESIAFPLEDVNKLRPETFYAIGFEGLSEPLMFLLSTEYT